jgi:hypothetical protein
MASEEGVAARRAPPDRWRGGDGGGEQGGRGKRQGRGEQAKGAAGEGRGVRLGFGVQGGLGWGVLARGWIVGGGIRKSDSGVFVK